MKSNRFLIFFIFGLSLLPKIYSDGYPSLFIVKEKPHEYIPYLAAENFGYSGNEKNALKFFISEEYPIYKACPEENATLHPEYALQVQGPLTDFKARPLKEFFEGSFDEYNCLSPIKPIVLKFKDEFKNWSESAPKGGKLLHIGFLIHETNDHFSKHWEIYENLTEEYSFINFLTVKMDNSLRTTFSVSHFIVNGQFLKPDTDWIPFESNNENVNIYGFDENQMQIFHGQPDRILVKVQLAPHGDFLLHTWKLPSFMDMNTTAMWIELRDQWKNIETFVRKVAKVLTGLTIETGAAKVLSLPDSKNEQQSIYLGDKQTHPVHKYFWKLVQFNQSHKDFTNIKAILIVVHNDPFTPDQERICDDVGKNLGWMISNNDFRSGLTYVCEVTPDITSKLHEDFKVKREIFNLKNLQMLNYDKNENVIWVNENIASKIKN